MTTHVQIRAEKENGPVIYSGRYSDMDFVNKDVIAGELLQHMLKRLHEYDITKENLNKLIDEGQKIVIKCWKDNV